MRFRTSDFFAVTVIVAIFSWFYAKTEIKVWMGSGASGPNIGQYSEYGVFSSALVIGKEAGNQSNNTIRIKWFAMGLDLAGFFFATLLTVMSLRFVRFYHTRAKAMRELDQLLSNAQDDPTTKA
jgi:hypothetical protein